MMYKFKQSKMFKLIAMVMVVAMLASVCMVEVLAEQMQPRWNRASVSGTFLNYPAFTEVYIMRPEARIYASCGYMAGITLDLTASFSNPNDYFDGADYRSRENTYCSYEATMAVRHENPAFTAVDDLQGETTITYNGVSWGPHQIAYYVGGNA